MRTFGSLFSEIQWQLILFNRKTYGLLKWKKSERRLNTSLNPGAQIVCQKSVPQLNFHYAGFIPRKVPRKNGNEFSGLILILLPTSLAIQEEKGNLSRSRYRQVWFLLKFFSSPWLADGPWLVLIKTSSGPGHPRCIFMCPNFFFTWEYQSGWIGAYP